MLYVVATPIGNLQDMSPRAVETLKKVALIAAEDTRVTRKLTAHFGISTPLTSCHAHNERDKSPYIISRMLKEEIDVALVTDAGTPAISDPGTALVAAACAAGIPVVAIAGPSAMAAALSVSGLDAPEFLFCGFLPRSAGELREKLLDIADRTDCCVLHESPHRIVSLMRAVRDTLPGAVASVSCDLTKLHEKTIRGDAADVLIALEADEKTEKGEYCIVLDLRSVKKREAEQPVLASLEARLFDMLLSGEDMRTAIERMVSDGEKKNAAYAASLRVKAMLK